MYYSHRNVSLIAAFMTLVIIVKTLVLFVVGVLPARIFAALFFIGVRLFAVTMTATKKSQNGRKRVEFTFSDNCHIFVSISEIAR